MVTGADEVGACATGTTAGAVGSTVGLTGSTAAGAAGSARHRGRCVIFVSPHWGGANFIVLGVAAHENACSENGVGG